MNIRFSKHADIRAKLYGIPESIVTDILADINLHPGEHVIIKEVGEFKYPLKIVVSVERDAITVITNYPMKKVRKK